MKRQRKKYEKPLRIWDKERIESEKKLLKEYGLRRKKEIWRMESVLRKYRRIARNLAAKRDKEKEKILLGKLNKLGLLKPDASLDDVLALTVENLLERRLQTLVYRKGLASTIKQARQLIVHGHIALDGRRVRWPSMLIPLADENKIGFYKKEIGEKVEKKS
ncbi:MAG: 30S ribosomal protein S4 [Candidatus Aenigmatarchaeota archaeon]